MPVTPRVLIDSVEVPGGGTMRLMRRGDDFTILLGPNELMSSRLSGSEAALATMAIQRMPKGPNQRMLIGGLGMGFTLRAALPVLGAAAAVTVAELVPQVIAWAHGAMAPIFGNCLDDPRVTVRVGDVGAIIREASGAYEAILLDVDNGPDGLTRSGNDWLYGVNGLAAARAALSPGGVLAIWSAEGDAKFARRFGQAGFAVEETTVRAHAGRRGAIHTIWFGVKA